MKKKYLPQTPKPKKVIRGAYDKKGQFWHEDDINTFTGGIIRMCFGKEREEIKIDDYEIGNIYIKI